MKKIMGICLVMVIFSLFITGALIAGIAFLGYKAYQEYQINKFSNKFKVQCAGIIILSLILITVFTGDTDKTQEVQEDTTTQIEQQVEEPKEDTEEEKVVKESEEEEEEVSEVEEAEPEEEVVEEPETVSFEYEQALAEAQNYVDVMAFSKQGLYEQLTSEYGSGFENDAAQYAVDNVNVDWYSEAVEAAEDYLNCMTFSKQGLYEQLTSEYGSGFTDEEAQYAVDTVYK